MLNIPLAEMLDKLPEEEMEQSLNEFVASLSDLLPEKRLQWHSPR